MRWDFYQYYSIYFYYPNISILASSEKGFGYRHEIHIWISQNDYENANLMILIGYIIMGHPEWKGARINIFAIFPEGDIDKERKKLIELAKTCIELDPKARIVGVPHRPGTHEYLFCEEGRLSVVVTGERFDLSAGDVAAFPGDQAHSYHNKGDGLAIGFSVVTLAPMRR